MNVYEKLQKARVDLQAMNLKKTGNNKFAGYQYYELADFLPAVNKIMLDLKLSSSVRFTQDLATLTITNSEKTDETIEFTSTIADAQLKGCHPVQNLGAVQTYIRRYLYTNAFEIVESDVLDLTTGKDTEDKKQSNQKPKGNSEEKISEAQQKRLFAIAKNNAELVKEVLLKHKYYKSSDIKKSEYEAICAEIEGALK